MSLSFPSNPSVGDRSFQNGRVYSWNGHGWDIVVAKPLTTKDIVNFTSVANVISVNGITGKPSVVAGTGISIATSSSSIIVSSYGNAYAGQQTLTGASGNYTLSAADTGKMILVNSESTTYIVVPSSSQIQVGTHIDIARIGIGDVAVTGSAGVTVNATPGLRLRARYSTGTLIKYGADLWLFVGDIAK